MTLNIINTVQGHFTKSLGLTYSLDCYVQNSAMLECPKLAGLSMNVFSCRRNECKDVAVLPDAVCGSGRSGSGMWKVIVLSLFLIVNAGISVCTDYDESTRRRSTCPSLRRRVIADISCVQQPRGVSFLTL